MFVFLLVVDDLVPSLDEVCWCPVLIVIETGHGKVSTACLWAI